MDMETKIEDATMKDGEITFNITRERNGNKTTMKYKLKLDGDSLKGTAKGDGANAREMEIDAKREKAEPKKDK